MLKLLGSVCILLAGAAVRRLQVRSIRRELAALEGVTAGLRELGDRIRLSRMPLPRLLGRVGENRERDARTFFQTAEETILGGQPPSEAWRRAAELLPVGARPQAALRELGERMDGDEDSVCKAISLATSQLEAALLERRARQADQEKRSTAICFSGAALLIILLI